jgi:uncharacterized protein YodC (DUF2158 family)
MNKFKEGSIVRLKSGGPEMTIELIKQNNCVCVWFNHNNEIQRYEFSHEVLQQTRIETL